MNKPLLLKRIEALEAARAKERNAPKPVNLDDFFAELALCVVAAKRRKHESILSGYARGARYRGGVAELFDAAYRDYDKFHKKHSRVTARPSPHYNNRGPLPDDAPTFAEIERVRVAVLKQFISEEMCWKLLDAIAANGNKVGEFKVRSDDPVPLAKERPFRAKAAA